MLTLPTMLYENIFAVSAWNIKTMLSSQRFLRPYVLGSLWMEAAL